MRNFEERKAEIFRRSENRIKQRKQTRKRILTVCIPLCLALTVGSAAILPDMLPVGADRFSGENAAIPEYAGENKVEKVQIEMLYTEDTQQNLTQEPCVLYEDAGQIYYSMEAAFEKDRGNEESKLEDSQLDMSEELVSGGGKHLPDYKITFVFKDGSEEVYTLEDYTLTKQSAGSPITLTQEQRNALDEKLELVEETK